MLFLDDPALVKDMIRFWTDYTSRLLLRVLEHAPLDYVHISEDMAYKEKPMIGPEMFRDFELPWGVPRWPLPPAAIQLVPDPLRTSPSREYARCCTFVIVQRR